MSNRLPFPGEPSSLPFIGCYCGEQLKDLWLKTYWKLTGTVRPYGKDLHLHREGALHYAHGVELAAHMKWAVMAGSGPLCCTSLPS